MSRRSTWLVVVAIGVVAVVGVVLMVAVPRWYSSSRTQGATTSPAPSATPGRRIKARLFYVAEDGERLTNVEREVALGEGTVEQARYILEAQIAPVTEPVVSAVPASTKLRAVFVTERGEAFADFSRELIAGHSGGSTNELLTVYAIVNALTANLPAIKSVQLLVDGKQVETLAGHVDLRRPIVQNLAWVE
jgi:spore germination protein GerM